MKQRFLSGDRVRIESGEFAGKFGIVVPRRSINFVDSRWGAIPEIDGAKGPLGVHDMLVRLDNGRIVPVPVDQLCEVVQGEYPLVVGVG
jgi:hypothetical protein